MNNLKKESNFHSNYHAFACFFNIVLDLFLIDIIVCNDLIYYLPEIDKWQHKIIHRIILLNVGGLRCWHIGGYTLPAQRAVTQG